MTRRFSVDAHGRQISYTWGNKICFKKNIVGRDLTPRIICGVWSGPTIGVPPKDTTSQKTSCIYMIALKYLWPKIMILQGFQLSVYFKFSLVLCICCFSAQYINFSRYSILFRLRRITQCQYFQKINWMVGYWLVSGMSWFSCHRYDLTVLLKSRVRTFNSGTHVIGLFSRWHWKMGVVSINDDRRVY